MSANLAVEPSPVAPLQRQPAAVPLQVFSTCPSSLITPDNYARRIVQIAHWSESAGCTGILIYTDNSLVDPWLVAQVVIANTKQLSPLVAVQPVYMHPYSVAKMVSTLAFMWERRVFLNMVAGGFKNDLAALNDTTPHDSRYARLVEYTRIIQQLTASPAPVSLEGQFYRVQGLALTPTVPPGLRPGFLMSGSSEAGLAAACETGATAIKYPEAPDQAAATAEPGGPSGVRIGIVTRPGSGDAWDAAIERFPEDRKGQLTRQLATKISDSAWHHRLTEAGKESGVKRETYWLQPFENYHTNCPYLVGSYAEVACELVRFLNLGHRTFILDIPAAEEEFEHIGTVFQMASRGVNL